MKDQYLSQMRDLVADFQVRKADFVAELDRHARNLRKIRARAEARQKQPPAYVIDARIRRREVKWDDVLLRESDDPDVQAAQKWLEPRLRLIEQGVFEAAYGERDTKEVFAEIDEQIRAWESPRSKRSGGTERNG